MGFSSDDALSNNPTLTQCAGQMAAPFVLARCSESAMADNNLFQEDKSCIAARNIGTNSYAEQPHCTRIAPSLCVLFCTSNTGSRSGANTATPAAHDDESGAVVSGKPVLLAVIVVSVAIIVSSIHSFIL